MAQSNKNIAKSYKAIRNHKRVLFYQAMAGQLSYPFEQDHK